MERIGTGWYRLLIATLLIIGLAPLGAPAPAAAAAEHAAREASTALAPLPTGWPSSLQLGAADGAGGAAALRGVAPFGLRYQYLSGGVLTGNGWSTWNPNGQFVTFYVQESVAQGMIPVFSYYMIRQSPPGSGMSEIDGVLANLSNTTTMTAYFNDLKLFFQRAGAFPSQRIVLHVEPDLWGYIQQRAPGDNGTAVAARVAATGLPELAGLPNNGAGLAQAIVQLRNQYAPNVWLGYHLSIWGTGVDIQISQTDDATTDALAGRAAAFYRSLGASFDIAFAEFSDRDAAFYQYVYGDGGRRWFTANDFRRHARFMSGFATGANRRIVLWQIPLGNTRMRAQNNTWNHYQDNRVEWLLDEPARTHLAAYRDAGVVALLFGRGANGATCACDANGDGVTNPAPINGNGGTSLNADDDGGFFKQKAAGYYGAGAMPLPSGGQPPPPPPGGGSGVGATTWYFAEGYTGAGFDEYLTILNPNGSAARVTIVYFLSNGSTPFTSFDVAPNSRKTVAVHDTAQGVGRGWAVAARVQSDNGVGIIVERPMYFRYGSAITGGHTVVGATAPAPTWYFAEGYTGAGFDQYLTILNPNPAPVTVAITYFLTNGTTRLFNQTIGATSRQTVAVHAQVGRGQEVATRVHSPSGAGIVVERPIYFTYGGSITGGHNVMGATQPQTSWYFAEGYTGTGFDEYLTMLNPTSQAAAVEITYFLANGTTRQVPLTIGPTTRRTVAVHEPGQGVGRGQAVAARVQSTNGVGLIVERPIYFTYAGGITGGHNVMGAAAARTSWYFAEGYTGSGFDQYLTLMNPGPTTAQVAITYFLASGAPRAFMVDVPPTSRRTIAVHDQLGRNQEVATRVQSTNGVPIVVERPIYFRYTAGIDGGHNVMGYAP